MKFFRHKFFLALAFFTAFFFLSISVGGEFFHEQVHHHQTKDSFDECPLHQILVQVFTFAVAAVFVLPKIYTAYIALIPAVIVSRFKYLLPVLRAPPASL